MSDPNNKNAERLRRIHEATEKAEPTAPELEPTANVIIQKMVQEIAELKRHRGALAEQVKAMQQEEQKQAVELVKLRSKQHAMEERLNKQQEQAAQAASKPKQSAVSATAIKTYIDDKLLTFKVQLVCGVVVVGVAAAAFLFWQKRSELEAKQPSATSSSTLEAGRPQ